MPRMQGENQAWFFPEDAPLRPWRLALSWLLWACLSIGYPELDDVISDLLPDSFVFGLIAIFLVVFVAWVPIQVLRQRRARAARLQGMQDMLVQFRSSHRAS